MATIKAIEARSVHQIQSGQVIVDLCSVVKELVENSLDANATSIEVRFKNNGLDSIEVQDNGSGIAPSNYETIALKHYTSKLSTYDDLNDLQTFGFRGEALSSLCALSHFHLVTAQGDEAPKGKRLEFEISGKLKSTAVVACQKGTTAVVEDLFESLPVRRKELTKNIKREYGKVVGLLHAYACISTGVKFTVKSSMPKGKSATVFATKGNPTTKENIANIYGAKTLLALLPLEQELQFNSTSGPHPSSTSGDTEKQNIIVRGHISRPVYGEGRQTPDRQMFFVNARPCGLPQIAKAFNEVYKSYNVSQSPFIFADLRMDTRAYDVNVSPDKRSILLHDSGNLIEALKASLVDLFEKSDQTVPQSSLQNTKLPSFKPLTVQKQLSVDRSRNTEAGSGSNDDSRGGSLAGAEKSPSDDDTPEPRNLLHDFFRDQVSTRKDPEDPSEDPSEVRAPRVSKAKEKMARSLGMSVEETMSIDDFDDVQGFPEQTSNTDDTSNKFSSETFPKAPVEISAVDQHVRDFNARIDESLDEARTEQNELNNQNISLSSDTKDESLTMPKHQPNIIQNAFDRMRPKRSAPDVATITVGDRTITTIIGSQRDKSVEKETLTSATGQKARRSTAALKSGQRFGKSLRSFAAPGTQPTEGELVSEGEESGVLSEASSETSRSVPLQQSNDLGSQEDGNGDMDTVDESDSQMALSAEGANDSKSLEEAEPDSDEEYIDEQEEKAKEEARVTELIRQAEEKLAIPTESTVKRANKVLKSGPQKDSTAHLLSWVDGSIDSIEAYTRVSRECITEHIQQSGKRKRPLTLDDGTAEDRLSLTVSKADFSAMHIVGQFNLGFILTVRPGDDNPEQPSSKRQDDELFIIDQHASDEKFNFERLQQETVVGNQRLVRPRSLELTAVEEEIILENKDALEKNGFLVEVDLSSDEAIGQRCKLVSLPLSKEVVFDVRDLEELIHLLSESPNYGTSSNIPRPSKVRKMFAMRACRSSIMIGKTLTDKQMSTVVRHMGEMDKPWNCPHGRPTMRHLMSIDAFDTWKEGGGLADEDEDEPLDAEDELSIWGQFA